MFNGKVSIRPINPMYTFVTVLIVFRYREERYILWRANPFKGPLLKKKGVPQQWSSVEKKLGGLFCPCFSSFFIA